MFLLIEQLNCQPLKNVCQALSIIKVFAQTKGAGFPSEAATLTYYGSQGAQGNQIFSPVLSKKFFEQCASFPDRGNPSANNAMEDLNNLHYYKVQI